ncbi:glycoside hydrolase family 16 protein [Actinomadura barringtoniae]|uniref:Glycoside hydrolase family 16 protein n=1 Tax=Actinomadura barringtoniae TaxID=1427535 RepID=A0A939T124_9ACTN|nr:glycoside hydrolase family 16 protein [Actinomadura barringtoniae]MBO2446601.1 glycoside hydrolase family 16 protein [Actinomadura barringtoniae]
MHRSARLALAAASAALVSTAIGTNAAHAQQATAMALPSVSWKQSWSSEFNGKGGIPPEWLPLTGNGTDGWSHRALQYYQKENVSQDGKGNLVIAAKQTSAWDWFQHTVNNTGNRCWNGACQYTSGRVQTSGKFSQAYGRFAARIKLPTGNGTWPTFWMQRDKPPYAEVDVVEAVGRFPNLVQGYAHTEGRDGGGQHDLGKPLSAGYHVYGVDWTPDKIVWWVDYQPYAEFKTAGSAFNAPFYLILSLGIGGDFAGDPWFTGFPQSMQVDWIRAYKAA